MGHLGDIADAINTHARANGYSVVEDIGGHGVGLEFHEDPFVSYVTPKGSEMLLVPGMMFTIEPMINEGSPDFFVDEDNDWTVYTMDDGLSAQIEYMVLITEKWGRGSDKIMIITNTDEQILKTAHPVFLLFSYNTLSLSAKYRSTSYGINLNASAGFNTIAE